MEHKKVETAVQQKHCADASGSRDVHGCSEHLIVTDRIIRVSGLINLRSTCGVLQRLPRTLVVLSVVRVDWCWLFEHTGSELLNYDCWIFVCQPLQRCLMTSLPLFPWTKFCNDAPALLQFPLLIKTAPSLFSLKRACFVAIWGILCNQWSATYMLQGSCGSLRQSINCLVDVFLYSDAHPVLSVLFLIPVVFHWWHKSDYFTYRWCHNFTKNMLTSQ